MESAQVTENLEECDSSESGWTMYLTSPMQDDDDGDGEGKGEGGGNGNKRVVHNEEDDDDDSMVSDASSGPAYSHRSYIGRSRCSKIQKANGCKKNHKAETRNDAKTTEGSKKEQISASFLGNNSKVRKKKTG